MGHYKTLLFDLDGTLTDPKEGITKCVQYALSKLGIEVEHLDELTPFIGPPLHIGFKEQFNLSEEEIHLAIQHFRERFKEVGMFENHVYDGVEQLLRDLKSGGYQLGVATSKPTVFAEQILAHFHLLTYFDVIVGSNLNGSLSLKSEIIEEVLRFYGEDGGQVVMIGDRKHDIIGANENGIDSIGVLFGYGSKEELREAGATMIIGSVLALREVLIG